MGIFANGDEQLSRKLEDSADQILGWRYAGRWTQALHRLDELHPIAKEAGALWPARVWLMTAQVKTDQALFGGLDTFEPRQFALDGAFRESEAGGDIQLLGDIWDAKGLSIHVSYLESDRSQEPKGELDSFKRGLELREQAGDMRGVGESIFHLGLYYSIVKKDEEKAHPLFEEALRRAWECEDPLGASYAIRHIAIGHYLEGDLDGARERLEESLKLREEIGFIPGVAMAHKTLGSLYAEMGEGESSLHHLHQAREIFVTLGAERRVEWVQMEIDQVQ